MMTRAILVLAFLLSLPTWAMSTTYYVTQSGAGATDGSNYANAYAGWSDINQGILVAGDIIRVCGTLSNAGSVMDLSATGTIASPVTLTGICPEEGGQMGALDGLGTAHPVFATGTVGGGTNIVVEYLTVTNARYSVNSDHCIDVGSFGGAGINYFRHLTISSCGGRGVNIRKAYTRVQDNTISHTGDDGIGVGSSSAIMAIIERNTISDYGDFGAGDGIECNTASTADVWVRDNIINHTNANSTKTGIICGTTTTGIAWVSGNRIVATPYTVTLSGTSLARGAGRWTNNYVEGFLNCYAAFNDGATALLDSTWTGNVCVNSTRLFRTSVTAGSPTFTVTNNTGYNVQQGASTSLTATALNVQFYNNVIVAGTEVVVSGFTNLFLNIQSATTYSGNNNVFYPDGSIQNAVCGGSTYASLALYQAACTTQDGSTQAINPQFISSTDYRTRGSSPLRRAGVDGYLCMDVRGRPCWHPPDIGAYQASSGDPASTRAARQ